MAIPIIALSFSSLVIYMALLQTILVALTIISSFAASLIDAIIILARSLRNSCG